MQAAALLRLARQCFDLDTSRSLRLIAQDMERRANQNEDLTLGYMRSDNGHSGDMERD
jgi:hypothetical protein